MKRWLMAWAAIVALGVTSVSHAGVDADPSKDYLITPDVGPWAICVTCYVGDKASELAHEMVLEIRSRFKMPAWVVNKGGDAKKKQDDEIARKRAEFFAAFPDANVPVPVRKIRLEEQYAVLIGGFKDMPTAEKALKEIRKLPPPSQERLMPILTRVRPNDGAGAPGIIEGAPANPFMMSFIVPNPAIPKEQARPENRVDDFMRRLNSQERYSLLKCRKPYTLMVAHYQGLQTIQAKADTSTFWDKLWNSSTGELLEASGQNAHNLAEMLVASGAKKLGLEVYILHTRHASIVSVGSYDDPNDPRMEQARQFIKKISTQIGRSGVFLEQPIAMEVPKP